MFVSDWSNHPLYRPSPGTFSGDPRPSGFSGPGMRQVFDAVLPMKGKERKRFYNQARAPGLVVGLGLIFAIIGSSWGGVVGAVFGFAVGATAGGIFVENRRFFR